MTGAHLLDFDKIQLEPGERPEDLFQRLSSFVEDNLLKRDGGIRHHGAVPDEDEDFIVLTWLRLIDIKLPGLVKQKYGPDLRSNTLASLKPEISQALDSLLDELRATADARVLRTAFQKGKNDQRPSTSKSKQEICPLCKQAGRPRYKHYLSKCKFLPDQDHEYLSRVRQSQCIDEHDIHTNTSSDESESDNEPEPTHTHKVSTLRRVCTKESPHMKVFYRHHPLQITLDTGAEISMIKESTAKFIDAKINKSSQSALQAESITPLKS